jgi:ferredoxin-thioredoxin reductase catalytic subunit
MGEKMIKNTFKIVRKDGWELNPDDNVVNHIIEELAVNYGHCPTHVENRIGHDQCPCSSWLTNSKCYCNLYVKKKN